MLDIREIEYLISRYEQEADKLDDCLVLSALYTIRDKLSGQPATVDPYAVAHSGAPATEERTLTGYGNSEFYSAIDGKEERPALKVIDDVLSNLQVVNPRMYDNVIRRLNAL